MAICPNCGTEIADTARFCRKCGTKIEAEIEAKIEAEEAVEKAEAPEFEEPVDTEDGGVDFNWDQPVEIEEPAAKEVDRAEAEHIEEPETVGIEEPAFEPVDEPAAGTADDPEQTYEWGPPTGEDGEESDESMMPVAFEGRKSSIPPWDHTHEFDPQDISENKVMAMAAYMLGPLGIIIAQLAAQDSPYAAFHVRQGLKLAILQALVAIIMVLLCWTFVVPAAAGICMIILFVVQIIAFVKVCKGRAEEPPIVRSIRFFR